MENNHKILDGKLVIQSLNGDENAYTTIVKKWHKRFCKQAFWYTKDKDLAKDIAQESWVTIFKNLSTLKDPESFGSWALSIVNRKSIDALCIRKRTQEKLKNYGKDTIGKDIAFADDDSIIDNHKTIMKAIHRLPVNQQTVLRLFYVQEYSIVEISKALKISKGTVKSRLFYAREQLKSILKR